MIFDAGRANNIHPDIGVFAHYYASNSYSVRCYARDYLQMIANGNNLILKSAACYRNVAIALGSVWDRLTEKKPLDSDSMRSISRSIKEAEASEEKGIHYIKDFLRSSV